jgi:hypothetical protein
VGSIKSIFMSVYFAACMAAVVYVPLFVLHGYRHWWLIALYALMAVTAVAGSISHYRTERRNRKSLRRQQRRSGHEMRRDLLPTMENSRVFQLAGLRPFQASHLRKHCFVWLYNAQHSQPLPPGLAPVRPPDWPRILLA